MLELICLRHWPTDWNREKRLQGRRDRPLADSSRRELEALAMPPELLQLPWFCSPLRRAQQTAAALGIDFEVAAALTEMDWGAWEGQRIEDLRRDDPAGMAAAESRGLALRPPGGESPDEVRRRLDIWAETLRQQGYRRAGAVCHKGVMRALLAAACDWDMRGKAPFRLDYRRLQSFCWDGERWQPGRLNRPLIGS
ncbi:phosphoglycerate mutase [Marinobacterium nitratireducens]|uniref:Phosphoglycerate mutase n=1 Tax=Marinobacterium nitratireducens TaxID=518897 RepID=A0A918DT81_9GAMM|nr:histidine phosphatase family protein [Marinobacterium nitratireducens]GGO81089.1 phosphoglycerate mutase [Marinobacterium nitratireducens]